ncbi:MAG: TIGR03915 family putative DNA repair protein [Eubacteriales bacterium]|nr:TIGR03915 family putative DNA repair protein [Eubacteriales bacterium]
MHIYTCEDGFENMMCCIYAAWEGALVSGHDNVRLVREPVEQVTFFDEYIHVDYDKDKFEKVVRSIRNKISTEAFYYVYYASLSAEEDALDSIYRFLVEGFKKGALVIYQYTVPAVSRIMEIRRNVGNEACHFKEFARFNSLDNKLYVCHLEPKNNVISIVGQHFADRMPSEYWLIIDDNRSIAVVHSKDEENYLRVLTEDEMNSLKRTEFMEDEYTKMWRTFFDAIAIKQRENYACQRNLFPIWMRKHTTEFMK